jgi:hypothetical protein
MHIFLAQQGLLFLLGLNWRFKEAEARFMCGALQDDTLERGTDRLSPDLDQ